MEVILCLDDRQGMMFNQRRQSRDKCVMEDILQQAQDEKRELWIHPYSVGLFPVAILDEGQTEPRSVPIHVSENFLYETPPGQRCLVENQALFPVENRIEKLIVYHWNRLYPSDFRLDIAFPGAWKLESCQEFSGKSHEKITKEVYGR